MLDDQIFSTVELHFPVNGRALPADHGYHLLGAVSSVVPKAHGAGWLGIHTFKGIKLNPGIITLPEDSVLRLRLPAVYIPVVYSLAGKTLNVGGHHIRCGIPQVRTLHASSVLRARTVIIKSSGSKAPMEPNPFIDAVQKQLTELAVTANIELELLRTEPTEAIARRTLRIKDITLVGYGVRLFGLNDNDSLKIQAFGIGGRRRMGCGLFVPEPPRHGTPTK
jgi:CRISPR-associated protein Cas6